MEVTAPSPGGSWSVTDAQNIPQVPSAMAYVLPFSGNQCLYYSGSGLVRCSRLSLASGPSPRIHFSSGSKSGMDTRETRAGLGGGGEAHLDVLDVAGDPASLPPAHSGGTRAAVGGTPAPGPKLPPGLLPEHLQAGPRVRTASGPQAPAPV